MENELAYEVEEGTFLNQPWRDAINKFSLAGFVAGDVVPHAWFYRSFEIEEPSPTHFAAEADRLRLAFLAQFTPFRNALLREKNVDLVSVHGMGYRITPPQEQTAIAYADGISEIAKGLRKMSERIMCVDMIELSDAQRRENAETLAKATALKNIFTNTRKRLGTLSA